MRSIARLSALVMTVLFAARVGAQTTSSDAAPALNATPAASAMDTTLAPSSGAVLTGLRAGVHSRETSRPAQPTMAAAERANLGEARALMVVGVAAMIAGAVVEGDAGHLIMVGGAVVGLIGLYEYVK